MKNVSEFTDLAEYGMEYARDQGASYSEARLIDGERLVFTLRNGNLVSGSELPWKGIGFRVLKNGGLSFVSVDELSKEAIRNVLDVGIKMATNSNPKDKIDFGEPIANVVTWEVPVKEKLQDITHETMLTQLKGMDEVAEEVGVNTRVNILESQTYDKFIVTSEGTKIHADISMLKFNGIITAKGTLDSEQRWINLTRSTGWEGTNTLLEEYKDACSRLVKVANQTDNRLTGKMDFVVSPEVTGIICHENAGHPSEGDRIYGREGAQAGESFWRDLKLKESRIGSDHVTIVEDPTIPRTGGFYLYDDEGVKARERILVNKGIINEPLLNREFGVKFGIGSNGSARSIDFNREPIIRMANTYMKPGDFTTEELVEDVKHGIFMNSFTEWNIDDRRYQSKYVGFECYEIKNGEVTETMVRRPTMEITSIGLFNSIDGVSNKLKLEFPAICGKSDPGQGVPVDAGGTYIRLRGIQLG